MGRIITANNRNPNEPTNDSMALRQIVAQLVHLVRAFENMQIAMKDLEKRMKKLEKKIKAVEEAE